MINNVDKRSLRMISDDKESDFQTLLENWNQLIIYQRNLLKLMVEVYKIVLSGYARPIVENLFVFWENVHNIRNVPVISRKTINTVKYGLQTNIS